MFIFISLEKSYKLVLLILVFQIALKLTLKFQGSLSRRKILRAHIDRVERFKFECEKFKQKNPNRNFKDLEEGGGAFHEKKEKNKKVNLGNSKKLKHERKYKKPKSRGDKIQNRRKKKRK